MKLEQTVRHKYNKFSIGKIVSMPETGDFSGKVQVQWSVLYGDNSQCYLHPRRFLLHVPFDACKHCKDVEKDVDS